MTAPLPARSDLILKRRILSLALRTRRRVSSLFRRRMARLQSRSQGSPASLPRKPPPTASYPASRQSNLSPNYNDFDMLFLTRCFGVTSSDAERTVAGEQATIEAITERVLAMQSKAAAQQKRPLRRGTHAKGICVAGQFEVFDVNVGRDPVLAARLAKGIFAKPGIYAATVRFANSDSKVNSDFKADVRSLSFSVNLTPKGAASSGANGGSRQDFSLQN